MFFELDQFFIKLTLHFYFINLKKTKIFKINKQKRYIFRVTKLSKFK